jgi:hypothetical protein
MAVCPKRLPESPSMASRAATRGGGGRNLRPRAISRPCDRTPTSGPRREREGHGHQTSAVAMKPRVARQARNYFGVFKSAISRLRPADAATRKLAQGETCSTGLSERYADCDAERPLNGGPDRASLGGARRLCLRRYGAADASFFNVGCPFSKPHPPENA